MKSTFASVLVAALAGLANAKIALTNSNFAGITVGQPFTITWTEATGPVTILLKNGPSDDLATVSEIASGVSGTSFTWTPESTIASGNYALEIEDGTDINFSAMFPVTGGTAPTPSAASTTMSMASTTSIATATSTEESSSSVSAESSESSSTATEAATTTSESGSSSSATTMTTKASSTESSTVTVSEVTSSSTAAPTTVPDSSARGAVVPVLAPLLAAFGLAALL